MATGPHLRRRRHARRRLLPEGKRWWLRLHEKGGKRHEMPAHHKLEIYIDEYIGAAGIRDDGKAPLFRTAVGRTDRLSYRAMHRIDRTAWCAGARPRPATGLSSGATSSDMNATGTPAPRKNNNRSF